MSRSDVLLIVHNYALDHNRVRMELDAIAHAGLSADLICLRQPGEPARGRYRTTRVLRIPIRRHRGARLPIYLLEYGGFLLIASLLASLLALRHRYRLVLVHSLPDVLAFAAVVPKLLGAHVVLNLREFTPELVRTRYETDESHALVRLTTVLERMSCALADTVITVHDTGAALLASRGVPESKLLVITNSIELPGVRDDRNGRAADEPFTLLYHGTAGNEYDLSTVVRAIAVLRARGYTVDRIRLRIVGSGPALPAVQREVTALGLERWVSIERPVPFAHVPGLLASADAGVPLLRETPYAHLGIPTKLLECVAAGIPVLSVPGRAILGYFPPDTLVYVPFGDAGALAYAIAGLVAGPREGRERAARARIALHPIAPEVMKARYAHLLTGIFPDRGAPRARNE